VVVEEVRDGGHDRRHGLRCGCGEDGRREGGRVGLPRHLAAAGVGFSGDFGGVGGKRARPGRRRVGDVASGASASNRSPTRGRFERNPSGQCASGDFELALCGGMRTFPTARDESGLSLWHVDPSCG
jgi:hypothetical protein